MHRQSFITTIKVWLKKKTLKSLIRFHGANKIENYNGGCGEENDKKEKRIPKETTEHVKT